MTASIQYSHPRHLFVSKTFGYCSTNQAVEAVIQENQENSLFLQTESSIIACQHSFHHAFEEEGEVAGLLLEHLTNIINKKITKEIRIHDSAFY